jgi:2-polyprenyl-3-methyl-5-hydroxy-6-metoxy-1,4-benzoquinol methylase
MESEIKNHWNTVYTTKSSNQVSWTQETPQTSLDFINSFGLNKNVAIIDIGGGDSNLVDHLLDQGYENITVLDISESAIEKAKSRLGDKAKNVTWIISDITAFEPAVKYDIWHDRAAFHFLTTENQIEKYVQIAQKSVVGYLMIATFSENGPLKCSGLEIKQYSESTLDHVFKKYFNKVKSKYEDHITPFDTIQNFVFSSFKRL